MLHTSSEACHRWFCVAAFWLDGAGGGSASHLFVAHRARRGLGGVEGMRARLLPRSKGDNLM
jgi:hypothetical protein